MNLYKIITIILSITITIMSSLASSKPMENTQERMNHDQLKAAKDKVQREINQIINPKTDNLKEDPLDDNAPNQEE